VSEVDGKKVSGNIAFRYNPFMEEERFIKKKCKRYNILGYAHE